MSASDYAKAMTEFWTNQSKALLDAQERASRSVTEGMQAMLAGRLPPVADGSADMSAVTTELGQAGDALVKLWSAASGVSNDLAGKLAKYVAGGKEDVATAVLERMVDPRQWMAGTGELDDMLARMAEGPRLADLWDLERRFARVMKAWTQLRRRALEQQRITLDAWMRAGKRYMEELPGHASAEGKPLDRQRALALWTEVANKELLQTQRSEQFLAAQRELIRASTELRTAQQDLVEHFGKQYGFPTRTELDDVHRTLTEMRRELRRMKRALADAQAAPPPPANDVPAAPAPAPRPTRRKAVS